MHPTGTHEQPEKLLYSTFQGLNDLAIHHYGPPLEIGALPALFYFALSGEESLNLDPYNQPAHYFASEQTRVFSFTLPGHGAGFNNQTAMAFWLQALNNQPRYFEEFFEKVIENIHFLVERGFVTKEHLCVAGLSRGGWIATHLAAREPLLKTLVGFAPLTRLGALDEFHGRLNHPYDLILLAERLVDCRIRFYIGNRDVRVGTLDCMDCILAFTEASYQKGNRSPTVELIVSQSIGHKGHGTSRTLFEDGANWMKEKVDLKREMN